MEQKSEALRKANTTLEECTKQLIQQQETLEELKATRALVATAEARSQDLQNQLSLKTQESQDKDMLLARFEMQTQEIATVSTGRLERTIDEKHELCCPR